MKQFSFLRIFGALVSVIAGYYMVSITYLAITPFDKWGGSYGGFTHSELVNTLLFFAMFALYVITIYLVLKQLVNVKRGISKHFFFSIIIAFVLGVGSLAIAHDMPYLYGGSSYGMYQVRGWPVGMVKVGHVKLDRPDPYANRDSTADFHASPGIGYIALNFFFWFAVANVVTYIWLKKHDETTLTT